MQSDLEAVVRANLKQEKFYDILLYLERFGGTSISAELFDEVIRTACAKRGNVDNTLRFAKIRGTPLSRRDADTLVATTMEWGLEREELPTWFEETGFLDFVKDLNLSLESYALIISGLTTMGLCAQAEKVARIRSTSSFSDQERAAAIEQLLASGNLNEAATLRGGKLMTADTDRLIDQFLAGVIKKNHITLRILDLLKGTGASTSHVDALTLHYLESKHDLEWASIVMQYGASSKVIDRVILEECRKPNNFSHNRALIHSRRLRGTPLRPEEIACIMESIASRVA